ncbi:hypothetical protein D3C76_339470 [compost metagenome]
MLLSETPVVEEQTPKKTDPLTELLTKGTPLADLQEKANTLDDELKSPPDFRKLLRDAFSVQLKKQYQSRPLELQQTWLKTFVLAADRPTGYTLVSSRTLDQVLFDSLAQAPDAFDHGLSGLYTQPLDSDVPSTRVTSALGVEQALDHLLPSVPRLCRQVLDEHWAQKDDSGKTRRARCIQILSDALLDEVAQKVKAGMFKWADKLLVDSFINGIEGPAQPQAYSLQLTLNREAAQTLAGVVLLSQTPIASEGQETRLLLLRPGIGLDDFSSTQQLFAMLDAALISPLSRQGVTDYLALSAQHAWQEENHWYWDLKPITEPVVEHGFAMQLRKQKDDVAHLLRVTTESERLLQQLDDVAVMKRFNLQSVVEHHEQTLLARQVYRDLPSWQRDCSDAERAHFTRKVQAYDQARARWLGALKGADSPPRFARLQIHEALKTQLGCDLDPDQLRVTLERTLPFDSATYTHSRTLTELALHGMHPGDEHPDSSFQTSASLTYRDAPLDQAVHPLKAASLAKLLAPLQLRASFVQKQRDAATPANLQLMETIIDRQFTALAYAAQLQGHLQPQDYQLIEAIQTPIDAPPSGVSINLLYVDGLQVGETLVIRKDDSSGKPDYLLLFTPEAPRPEQWQRLRSAQHLLEEVVAWSGDANMRQYLLSRVDVKQRDALQTVLANLAKKPKPPAGFIKLTSQADYQTALGTLAQEHATRTQAVQDQHTPAWYREATAQQRRQLIELEDRIDGAQKHYRAQTHTNVQPFNEYLREKATEKLNALLGNPKKTVDPDQVIITTPREVVSYTQMLRDGYDDSVGFIKGTADSTATFKGPEGVDLSPLTAQKVAGSVRGQWVSDHYCKMIEQTLLEPQNEGYDYRRQASVSICQMQMKLAALTSQLKGEITDLQLRWLNESIDSFDRNDPSTRKRYPVYPLQFALEAVVNSAEHPWLKGVPGISELNHLLGTTESVEGNYVLTHTDSDGHTHSLLYTPDAPDGLAYRNFSAFATTLKNAGMGDYYKDRMHFKLGRWMSFRFKAIKEGGGVGPYLPNQPILDLKDCLYDQKLKRRLLNVRDSNTSRADMISKVVWTSIELIGTAVTLPFPPASFAVGMALAWKDSALALQAFGQGDNDAAGGHIFSAILNSLGAWGDLDGGLKGFGRLWHGISQRVASSTTAPAQGLATPSILPATRAIDSKYALKHAPQNLNLRTDGKYAGVYEGPRQADGYPAYYIKDDAQRYYQVEYSARSAYDNWRILDTRYGGHKAPVRRNELGHWETVRETPTIGGNDHYDTILEAFKQFDETDAALSAAHLNLPAHWPPTDIRHALQNLVTRDNVQQMVSGFDFPASMREILENQLAKSLHDHKRFPAWITQYRKGAQRETTLDMLRTAHPEKDAAQLQAVFDEYEFPSDPAHYQWQLAFDIRANGQRPEWANAFHRPPVVPATTVHLGIRYRPAQPGPLVESWAKNYSSLINNRRIPYILHSRDKPGTLIIELHGKHYEVIPFHPLKSDVCFLKHRDVEPGSYGYDGFLAGRNSTSLDQPQLVVYKNQQWHYLGNVFPEPIATSIARIFPSLTKDSCERLARRMFQLRDVVFADTPTTTRLGDIKYAFVAWEGSLTPPHYLSDPLEIIPTALPDNAALSYKRGPNTPHLDFNLEKHMGNYFSNNSPSFNPHLEATLKHNGYIPVNSMIVHIPAFELLLVKHPKSENLYLLISRITNSNRLSFPTANAAGWGLPARWQTILRKAMGQEFSDRVAAANATNTLRTFLVVVDENSGEIPPRATFYKVSPSFVD